MTIIITKEITDSYISTLKLLKYSVTYSMSFFIVNLYSYHTKGGLSIYTSKVTLLLESQFSHKR